MSTQQLLTFLFNAIALGFTIMAVIDFGTISVAAYKQVSVISNSPKTNTQQPTNPLPMVAIPEKRSQLPDPWSLPLPVEETVASAKLAYKEQKHLRLLPPAKAIDVSNPKAENLLLGVDLDKLKLRQARKIAKVLGIAQKVNGRDQKLGFLVSQIKLKLQQAKAEIVERVKQELLAC